MTRSLRHLKAELDEIHDRLPIGDEYPHHLLARKFGVTPRTIKRYIKEEGLPAEKKGNIYYVKADDFSKWVRSE